MKGIILAGGSGTRLYPSTIVVSKQLLPIYDKPLIYYPLSMLMLAGIREILIISTPHDIENYKKLLGDGSRIGVHFEYAVQDKPRGLADAFIIGEDFIGNDSVCLVLGDNVFYGATMSRILKQARESINNGGAAIFGCFMKNPQEFGVVEFDSNKKVISYIKRGQLQVTLMGRGVTWFDTGSPKGMHKASGFVKTLQEMQGFYISCIEEIAWRRGFIDDQQLKKCGEELKKTDYGKYLLSLLDNEEE